MSDATLIPIRNIYFLLAYALGFQFNNAFLDEFVGVNHNLPKTPFDFLGYVFLCEVNQIERLHRGYSTHQDALKKPRGKALISRTIANASIERRRSVFCEFQDFTEDVAINQVLKLALHEIQKKATSPSIKASASLASLRFADISLKLNFHDTKSIPPLDQNTRRYQRAIQIAKLILHPPGLFRNHPGRLFKTFNQENSRLMALIFESFVREFLKHKRELLLPNLDIKRKIAHWDFKNLGNDLASYVLPDLKTDIVIENCPKPCVIEIKFIKGGMLTSSSRGDKKTLVSAHLMQLTSYIHQLQFATHNSYNGILLYAAAKNEPELLFEYDYNGSRLICANVDLAQNEETISSKLLSIIHKGIDA